MLTLIGLLIIIAGAILSYFKWIHNPMINKQNEEITEYNRTREEYYHKPLKTPITLPFMNKPWMLFIVGGLVIALNGLFFWNPSGTATAIQYPWGGDKMVTSQGPKLKFWGKTIPLSYEMSVKDVIIKQQSGESQDDFVERRKKILSENHDGIYNRQASQREFSDAIKAFIATSVIVGVDTEDGEVFLNMADRNRSEGKLIYGRVMPNIDAALKNTAKLMDAQEYISGKASDFDRYFKDQLQNGMYLVEEYTQEKHAPEIIGDSTTIRTVGVPNDNVNKQSKWRIKRDVQGNIMRDKSSNTLKQYGITIYQAQVTNIDWEASFDERLKLQKEQVAQTQLEKQEAEKEYYRAKKEIAKAESNKAKRRGELELKQVEETIAAETRAKVAEQDLIAEKKTYEVEQYKAKSKKVAADAQYYENAKLVSAGLTPQEKAELELEKAKVISANFAKMATPSTIIMGGGSKGSNTTETLIQAAMAKQVMNDTK